MKSASTISTAVPASKPRAARTCSGCKLMPLLLKRVREHDAPLRPVLDWIHARCEAMGTTPEELTRREHLRQAADRMSVGNAITSMRAIAALDWTHFFELTSGVEEVLRRDPC